MKRVDRLIEIEKLWKSRKRYDYPDDDIIWFLKWEEIQWDPFSVKSQPHYDFEFPDVPKQLHEVGHFMYIWGYPEVASGTIEWDWVLLRGLYTWYILPEDCDAPLFVNEIAGAICIPDVGWAEERALLFQHPASVLLGMEHLKAKKAAAEAVDKAKTQVVQRRNGIEELASNAPHDESKSTKTPTAVAGDN